MIVSYTCGFYLATDTNEVLLMRRAKKDWQCGLLNGIGGRIEERELPLMAMTREFREETGRTHDDCRIRCMMSHKKKATIHFYAAVGPKFSPTPCDEGTFEWHCKEDFPKGEVIHNLLWLIPFCFDFNAEPITVQYGG